MMTTATHKAHDTTTERVLFVAFALSEKPWKLGCTTVPGQQPRERSIAACHQARLLQEIAQAKQRFGLPDTAPVVSGSEAGRAGVWLHRFLPAQGITNSVVDSSSIAVHRRRRAKRDGLAVRQLVSMLRRYTHGERDVGHVGHVPSVDAEEQRHLHRDLATRQQERARTTPRSKSWLSSQGGRLTSLSQLPAQLEALRLWDGAPLPSGLRRRVLRGYAPHQCLRQPLVELEAERRAMRHTSQEAPIEKVCQLRHLRGIGIHGV